MTSPGTTRRLAVIPARGGSKRVPSKNLRTLAGRPLVAHTIEAAVASGLFADVVVSTDDPAIAAASRRWGAAVPFLREPALADDHSPSSAVTLDALDRMELAGRRYAAVAQLLPTCPLRTGDDVRASFDAFADDPGRPQISVTVFGPQNPWWAAREVDGRLERVFPDAAGRRSQDLPELVCPTGAIWWAEPEALRRAGTFHAADRRPWRMPWARGLDIDTEEHWALAEALLATVAPALEATS